MRPRKSHALPLPWGHNARAAYGALSLPSPRRLVLLAALASVSVAVASAGSASAAGELSPAFANPGITTVKEITVQPDGKIIVVYQANQEAVKRLNADGTNDDTFVYRSADVFMVNSAALQPDGKIVVGGDYSSAAVRRLDANGTFDSSFTPPGFSTAPVDWRKVLKVAVQPDGKILIGGWFSSVAGQPRSRVARLNDDGTIDNTFVNPEVSGSNPQVGGNLVTSMAIQPNGKILIAGLFSSVGGQLQRSVARLNTDGTVDNTFANPAVSGQVHSISLHGGKILISGGFNQVAGQPRSGVARLNSDGTLDATFADPEIGASFSTQVYSTVTQPDGKVLVGGWFETVSGQPRSMVARLNGNGTLDGSFTNAGADREVRSVAVLPDGKVLIAGWFVYVSGKLQAGVARLNANGTLDASADGGSDGGGGGSRDPVVAAFNNRAVLAVRSGQVKVRAPGSSQFVDVASGSTVEIKDGSEVDTTGGQARLSYQEAPGSADRSADVSKGRFAFDQRKPRSADPAKAESITELALSGPLVSKKATRSLRVSVLAASACVSPYQVRKVGGRSSCGRYVTRKVKKKKVKVWVERSSLVTKGRNGVGTDKGTEYEVVDSRLSTTFRVFSGTVLAIGGKPAKAVTIKAGKAYTFKAKAARKK